MRTATLIFLIIIALSRDAPIFADGGTLRLSQRVGDLQVSVFTSPSVPRVGSLDISVLVQDAASGRVQAYVPVEIRLDCVDAPAIPLVETASTAAATNKLFQAATFDVPVAGAWQATAKIGHAKPAELRFDLEIAPPLPPWFEFAPWLAWPLAVVALFLVHQRLVAKRQSNRHQPRFPAHSLQPVIRQTRAESANA